MFDVVLITWVDAMSFDLGLVFPEELPDEDCVASIVGFLVKETDTKYFLAKEFWETGQCKYVHIVPKRSVLSKEVIKPKKKQAMKNQDVMSE